MVAIIADRDAEAASAATANVILSGLAPARRAAG